MPLTPLTSAAEVLVAADHDPYVRGRLSRTDVEGWAGHDAVAWRFSDGHVMTHGAPAAVALLLEALLTELRDKQSVTVPRGTAPLDSRHTPTASNAGRGDADSVAVPPPLPGDNPPPPKKMGDH